MTIRLGQVNFEIIKTFRFYHIPYIVKIRFLPRHFIIIKNTCAQTPSEQNILSNRVIRRIIVLLCSGDYAIQIIC